MVNTVRDHLIEPNTTLDRRGRSTQPTYNPNWSNVENVYECLYKSNSSISGSEPERTTLGTRPERRTCRNEHGDRVDNLPRSQFIAAGARKTEKSDIEPDWGAGDDTALLGQGTRAKAIVYGDTKYLWPYQQAVKMIQENPDGSYLEDEAIRYKYLVQPFEQVQHYGIVNNTSLHFIITDDALVVIRLHLSSETIRTSPRQLRSSTTLRNQRILSVTSQAGARLPGHRRLSSVSSDEVGSVSEMSIDDVSMSGGQLSTSTNDPSVKPHHLEPDISALEYAAIPWKRARGDGMTVNLALWCLIKLAGENNTIQEEYDSLTPRPTRAIGVSPVNNLPSNTNQPGQVGRAKATDKSKSTTTSGTSTINVQYCDVKLFPSSKGNRIQLPIARQLDYQRSKE
ncbi:hypothetical protein BO71DRAFT_432145 [Aspergillus ellipticus CBS 707.79]|uniref:Uncharacterized protein n=1 Tax=Aspergillus ellipticus CBS 707.79 TaxID=1448320 RepID=A0A319D3Y4_9EURO|nr:hypothetical protein BO71DRAFT_432145 [Aspergillus ellipticus CBS 707.79]